MENESIRRAYKAVRERRDRAELTAQRRNHEILSALPAARPLVSALSQTGGRIARIFMQGGDGVKEQMEAAARDNLDAQQKLGALLLQNGYPENYLEPPYECALCGDTGYVNGRRCNCLGELAARYAAEEFNESAHIGPQSFADFSLRYYDEPARKTMEAILDYCTAYAERFSEKAPSILMVGETGLGKTHLSLAIAEHVMKNGGSAMYSSSPDLFRRLQNEYYGKGGGENTMDTLLTSQLVVLDDVGAEMDNQFNVSALYNIVNSRLNAQKPTIINTNLTPKELERRYGNRVASRLMTMYQCLKFAGRDVRQQKLKNHEL